MKSKIKIINIFLIFAFISFTDNIALAFEDSNLEMVYSLDKFSPYIAGGYRMDKLNYNIASDATGTKTPNIASELKWDKLQIYQYRVGTTIPVFTIQEKQTISYKPYYIDTIKLYKQNLYFDVSGSKGNINSGENQVSDYDGDNRTMEFSRSNNDGGSGSVKDYSASLNYEVAVKYFDWISSITPMIGYSQYEQNLRITNGMQTLTDSSSSSNSSINGSTPPAVGKFDDLNSSYSSKWKGPFIGIGVKTSYNNTHSFAFTYQYHKSNYSAEGNWNLRDDLKHPKSFSQSSTGNGRDLDLEYGYRIFENVTFNLNLNYKVYSANGGTIKFNNTNNTTTTQKLNQVEWQSIATMAGFKFNF
jgi:hypothetical protein